MNCSLRLPMNNPWLEDIERRQRRERRKRFRFYCWLVPAALATAVVVLVVEWWSE